MTYLGPSEFVRFRISAPFNFRLSVFEPRFSQRPDGSRDYYTRSRVLRPQLQAPNTPVRIMADKVRLKSLPPTEWARDYGRQRVLFVLPSDALGDCVGVVLFLRAFRSRFPEAKVTIANTGAATDIFALEPGLEILPLVISEKDLARHYLVIDLGAVDGWDTVITQPVDVETALLEHFGLEAVECPLRPPSASPRIAILPLASSPPRTLPPALIGSLARALAPEGRVSVLLNSYQGVKAAYERALMPNLPEGIEVLPGFPTIDGLLTYLSAQDHVVCADSGPAHLTKLFSIQGTAIYTSAAGAVLQGRHRNLACWQSSYKGPTCQAPCGLAKLRATASGQVGCMGSLGVTLEDLPALPQENASVAGRLAVTDPVPCVADLGHRRDEVAAFVLDHFRKSRRP